MVRSLCCAPPFTTATPKRNYPYSPLPARAAMSKQDDSEAATQKTKSSSLRAAPPEHQDRQGTNTANSSELYLSRKLRFAECSRGRPNTLPHPPVESASVPRVAAGPEAADRNSADDLAGATDQPSTMTAPFAPASNSTEKALANMNAL
ncbi:hypothetical protein FRC01_001324 [Tulasnella sp. 417]|nr:hypothetical protein FRC01_001324 [Tulasnella sp. 417]